MTDKKPMAILYDMTCCTGCRQCMKACNKKQGFEGDVEQIHDLCETSFSVIKSVAPRDKDDDEHYYRSMCRHCVEPTCASVCPVGALHKTPEGPVVYEVDRCMGCRYCMTACPFSVPRYTWHDPVPSVRKCNMCYDRILEGKETACAEACPNGATIFGTREEMLAEAHKRIQESPDDYYDHVYGEHEVGGTSVLFLAPFPLEELGFKESLGTEPMPVHTWRVIEKIPGIAVSAAATMLAFWWITQRREEVSRFEAKAKAERKAHHGNGRLSAENDGSNGNEEDSREHA